MPRPAQMIAQITSLLTLALVAGVGCSTIRTTNPPRTATELFLLNVATERAVESLSFPELRDRQVFVSAEYVYGRSEPSQEQSYLMGELRAKLLASGARLVNQRDEAEIVAEVRVQSLGIDRLEYIFGLPAIATASDDLAGEGNAVVIPEIAFLRNLRQKGFSALAVVTYWRDGGELVSSTPVVLGKTSREDFWIFGVGPQTVGDIPPADQ
ncbi:MAG: DUF6655 family protein [Planctomycetota bacterium]